MSFQNVPGIKRNPINPAIGPLTNPAFPQLQPQMQKNQAKIMMNSNTANTHSNYSPKSKPSGRKVGGKTGVKRTKNKPTPVAVLPRFENNDVSTSQSIRLVPSDFGYSVDGSPNPIDFVDGRDVTLFRDYNVRSQVTSITAEGQTNLQNDITNQFKTLNINPKASWDSDGYRSQIYVILDIIRRDVIANSITKAATDVLDGLPKYLSTITIAYATLIQIEGLQAWNPGENSYYDRSLRHLANKMSKADIIDLRNELREALIPHVLPVGWMKYIKWLYSAHLRNHSPYSTKLRFLSGHLIRLASNLLKDESYDDFSTYVKGLVDAVRAVDQNTPSVMLKAVTCIDFANVKAHYDGAFNSASYDAEWNNIFNNRRVLYRLGTAPEGEVKSFPTAGDVYYSCLDTVNPYSMVLADSSRQASPDNPGLPLEDNVEVVKITGQDNYFNRFILEEENSGTIIISPLTDVLKDNTDSIHRWFMLPEAQVPDAAVKYSQPAGIQSLAVIASKANALMAARESLTNMTLK